ncbi:MAG: DUF4412 domain-containing protein [Ignavibacteriaceae bacterium]|nr:DUF4412 domain-containing protein [Ignavibacteriaceae bacterium]
MQTSKSLFALIFFLLAEISFAQGTFEGKITIEVEADGEKQVINYLVKDLRFRMETPDADGAMVYDSHVNKMYIIMDEQQAYMENFMLPETDKSTGSYTNTGETKNLLGYSCEKFLFQQDDTKGEAWMTKELGGFILFGDLRQQQLNIPSWKSELLEAGYFPLQVAETDDDANILSTFKVTVVVPQKLDAGLFVPPSSYKKFEMPSMNFDSVK